MEKRFVVIRPDTYYGSVDYSIDTDLKTLEEVKEILDKNLYCVGGITDHYETKEQAIEEFRKYYEENIDKYKDCLFEEEVEAEGIFEQPIEPIITYEITENSQIIFRKDLSSYD